MTKVFIDSYALDFTKDDPSGYVQYQQLTQVMFKYEAECIQPFEASSRTYMLNNLVFASSLTNTYRATFSRDAELARTSAWDYVAVFLYRELPVRINTDYGQFEIPPDELLFVDLSKPITIEVKNTNLLSLNIPTALLSPLVQINDGWHGMVLREQPHAQLLTNYMKTLEHTAPDIQTKDVGLITDTITRMLANCLTNASLNEQDLNTDKPNVKVSLLQIKHTIDAQIEDTNLSLDSLIQQFHVSRATMYRMFEPLGGISSYIQDRKLTFAYRVLCEYSEKKHNISMLAYKLGFSHASVFTRAFQAKFGVSPSAVKATLNTKTKQDIPWHLEIDLEPYKR